MERRLAAIMMADAAGYSRLMSRDETATVRTLIAHRGVMDLLIVENGGRIANTAGDSVLAEFASAGDALRAAVAMQERLGALNSELPEDRRLDFRVGVHVGEVVPRGHDLLGDGVNIAARVQAIAPRGGVCISAGAHVHVRKLQGFVFRDLGPKRLKNLEEPIRVYSVLRVPQSPAPGIVMPEEAPAAVAEATNGRESLTEAAARLYPSTRLPQPVLIGAASAIAVVIAAGLYLTLAGRSAPTAAPLADAAPALPAAAAAAVPAPPSGPVVRLTLLSAPSGSTCQAQLYQLQPRFTETVVDVPRDEAVLEVDGRDLCGLAVAGAAFQRGTGSAVAQSHSSPGRVVFAQTGRPVVAPAIVLTGGEAKRVEIRIR